MESEHSCSVLHMNGYTCCDLELFAVKGGLMFKHLINDKGGEEDRHKLLFLKR